VNTLIHKTHTQKGARFETGALLSKLIPALLVVILLGLIATLVITVLSILGITPGI